MLGDVQTSPKGSSIGNQCRCRTGLRSDPENLIVLEQEILSRIVKMKIIYDLLVRNAAVL